MEGTGSDPPNTNVGTSLQRNPSSHIPRQGYLYLLEVHRLADELVVLGQFLAGRQLDEHLAELTSTTTARRDTVGVTHRPRLLGEPPLGQHPLFEDKKGETVDACRSDFL